LHHQAKEIALIDDQQLNLGIETTEPANLLILLGHKTLFEDGELDEQVRSVKSGRKALVGWPLSFHARGNSTGSYDH
jgi:hypothetical protein